MKLIVKNNSLFFFSILIGFLSGCTKEIIEQETAVMSINYPSYIQTPNQISLEKRKVSLGKQLFFDKNLSKNNQVSCSSCHLNQFAFGENVALSKKGVSGKSLKRNSPVIFNMAWHNNFFWDGGAKDLSSQVFGPLLSPDEMGADLKEIENYLKQNKNYNTAFKEIYSSGVRIANLADAIAEYELSITSFNSKYDKVKSGEASFSDEEQKGFQLYLSNCSSCHTEGLFSDYKHHNNGLDSIFADALDIEAEERGRNRITNKTEDLQAYKTATLRNITLSAPYMHDGRFQNLEEVINHYSNGIKPSSSLSSHIPNNSFGFSKKEKTNIITFLKTLDDTSIQSK